MKKSFILWFLPLSMLCMAGSCDKCDPTEPTVSTAAISAVTATSAIAGGDVTSDGGAPVTDRGVCWNTSSGPTIANNPTPGGSGIGIFSITLTGLSPGVTYYLKAFATNSAGTGYGSEVTFTTSGGIIFNPNKNYGTLTDIDGNVYKTIQIGSQIWMAENLKTTKYKDGTIIPIVTDNNAWSSLSTPGMCWYNNDVVSNKNIYGALYNWYTINTGTLCPSGWHVPSNQEWTQLTTYLGGELAAQGKLKEIGFTHWIFFFENTNESGFTALPGGYRTVDGTFWAIGQNCTWWSSSVYDMTSAWGRNINYTAGISFAYHKIDGLSVRCLKD